MALKQYLMARSLWNLAYVWSLRWPIRVWCLIWAPGIYQGQGQVRKPPTVTFYQPCYYISCYHLTTTEHMAMIFYTRYSESVSTTYVNFHSHISWFDWVMDFRFDGGTGVTPRNRWRHRVWRHSREHFTWLQHSFEYMNEIQDRLFQEQLYHC